MKIAGIMICWLRYGDVMFTSQPRDFQVHGEVRRTPQHHAASPSTINLEHTRVCGVPAKRRRAGFKTGASCESRSRAFSLGRQG